jgi:peptidoglycan/xylan/chitin deacetylase (PgdA/CDA1 family)
MLRALPSPGACGFNDAAGRARERLMLGTDFSLVRAWFGERNPTTARESAPRVWLTFDDGPSRRSTPRLLATLEQRAIKATFFVVGKRIAAAGSLLADLAAQGHRIGNHSYSHPDLRQLTEAEIADEVRRTEDEICRYTKIDKIFRPPYGYHDEKVDSVIESLGYRMVFWNVDPRDWDPEYRPSKWVSFGRELAHEAGAEARIVLHDRKTTAKGLKRFIRGLGDAVFEEPSTL